MTTKYPWIRTVYLYLFSTIGLILLITGCVQFLNMGLKAYVFTQAEHEEEYWYMERAPFDEGVRATAVETNEAKEGEEVCLSENEKEQMITWLDDYEERQTEMEDYDPILVERHQTAAIALAQILVGLPLFLFHWLTIRRENKQ